MNLQVFFLWFATVFDVWGDPIAKMAQDYDRQNLITVKTLTKKHSPKTSCAAA